MLFKIVERHMYLIISQGFLRHLEITMKTMTTPNLPRENTIENIIFFYSRNDGGMEQL